MSLLVQSCSYECSIHSFWMTEMNMSACGKEDKCQLSWGLMLWKYKYKIFCNAVIANPVFLQICNLRLNILWMWSWILQTSPLWTTSGTSWAMSALFRLWMASWISQTSVSPQVRTELTQLRPSYCRTSFHRFNAQGCLGSAQKVFWHLPILPQHLL